jgi:hypothetical protein
MKVKDQVIYDITSNRFKHLKRGENAAFHKVDINELNRRLNITKKKNFIFTFSVVILSLVCLSSLVFIGIKF